MEDIMRPHSCHPTSAPSKLAMHRDSHVISKFKPKVRIIHIFAPEIIKTDVENFRELVQRLTGKPGDGDSTKGGSRRKKTRKIKNKTNLSCESSKRALRFQDGLPSLKLKMEDENNEIRGSSENSSDFLEGFADFSGFIHDLSDNFSSAPPQSSHMDMFGDMQLA
ncbi:hypothetical protein P3X46_013048 [Hevea brasiliensis]|uniref:VQ domain-containing protein n=1 Tax=Hevea brasiliensis TaxID=3981 RepID=A0ABQ9M2H0_HEVBR|nr:VQ motif-containing protein 25 [Hevea brasiliensis]KAJ9174401.1 hypothetical protein P3X46_013048 [Hevea brasiliensis]